MRLNYPYIFAWAILMALPTGQVLAGDSNPADAASHAAEVSVTDMAETPVYHLAESPEEFAASAPTENEWLAFEEVPETRILGARFGWWGVANSGSQNMTGEWQGLQSSTPFFDVDGLLSNGTRTLDFFITGPEGETNKAGFHYYHGPGLTFDLDYDRFLHRTGHQPLDGFYYPALPTTPANNGYTMFGEDLNAGQDYALRVQTLKANFSGNLTENIRWRLNVWGMQKDGTRQANAVTHCYNVTPPGGNRCHLVSRGQSVDWLTMEIEPVIEARLTEWLTVEYSRTMRSFQQNDELMLNNYAGSAGFPSLNGTTWAAYGVVPENTTEIDRVKIGAQLGSYTDAYVLGYVGNMHNKFRETDRHFGGVDGRITNRSFDGLQLTGYGRHYTQNTEQPGVALNTMYPGLESLYREATLADVSDPVDRDFTAFGAQSRWRPFYDDCNPLARSFAVLGGYEYRQIQRRGHVSGEMIYELENQDPDYWIQPNTSSNRFWVGAQQDWTCTLSSQVKYTYIATDYPLYGVTPANSYTLDSALNSSLPTDEHRIELTGTWTPVDNFILSGTFWIEQTWNDGPYVSFDEDSYPFMITAWYAPTCKWSLTGGFADLTNWIYQDITLGANGLPGRDGRPELSLPLTAPWRYAGRADVATLSTSYAVNDCLTLTGGAEYVWGTNVFVNNPQTYTVDTYTNVGNNTTTTDVDMSDLPSYSRVALRTWRLSAGWDYLVRRNVSTFFRYNYYDFGDLADLYNAGQSHMFLAGLTGTY